MCALRTKMSLQRDVKVCTFSSFSWVGEEFLRAPMNVPDVSNAFSFWIVIVSSILANLTGIQIKAKMLRQSENAVKNKRKPT